ncbi:Ribosomal protein L28 [Ostreococcus tauri]|uniref:Large ribosomal subunit protein bL28m n=1 Tax=Ostreococcus tauri TaxID=70448 RepID=A0A090M6F3_OSTTA|nr:Ribosomal protein L28 [Ostreococcus tauri]CEF97699.1 Ribosomal protein L28 [Ostreococcus tauri]|eukprot:XP_022838838.1 Ribosomal protein L28 [Ostreococcus tauri]
MSRELASAAKRALARVVQGKARRGVFAGKHIKFGNMVSEDGGNKTRRRWSPNVQKKRVYSELLERMIPMRVTTKALRCMDKAGGLDEYILKTRDDKLASEFAIALKAQLRAALRAKEASGAATESVVDFSAGAGAA